MDTDTTPIGTIIMWGGTLTMIPEEYLLCDGSTFDSHVYPVLAGILTNYWGNSSDGVSCYLPDMRGLFPRGVDAAKGLRDPDFASRVDIVSGAVVAEPRPGTLQTGIVESHVHHIAMVGDGIDGKHHYLARDSGPVAETRTEGTGGKETRPINVYVHFLIKCGPKASAK